MVKLGPYIDLDAIREAQAVANRLPAIVVDERGLRGLRPKYLIQA
jgi:hypothetical protein